MAVVNVKGPGYGTGMFHNDLKCQGQVKVGPVKSKMTRHSLEFRFVCVFALAVYFRVGGYIVTRPKIVISYGPINFLASRQ